MVRFRKRCDEPRLDRLKTARNAVAKRLELQSGVVCPNGTLESIARENPATLDELANAPPVRSWQAAEFGKELLAAMASEKQKTENRKQKTPKSQKPTNENQ